VFLLLSRGVWETMPELGDSVFISYVHLFTIKFVKGPFARLAKLFSFRYISDTLLML
jgi:hypothetical protein